MRTHLLVPAGILVLAAASPGSSSRLTAPQDAQPGPAVLESSVCSTCHSGSPSASAMRDAQGRSIAPFDLWRSSMMANAARDPFWRAQVAAEVAATPSRRAEIEAECLSCHAPMAHRVGLEDHDTGTLAHALDCGERLGALARDGVSCTVCHGMTPEDLGSAASFSGHFHLDVARRLYGPHAAPFLMPMRAMTGFTPTASAHVLESSLCGSCHTLETTAFDAEGREVGARLLEQAPYLEWRNSAFVDEGGRRGPRAASCQACHLPTVDEHGAAIRTRIVRNPGGRDFPPTRPRQPYGRHVLVGGNPLVLSILAANAEELGVEAPGESFAASVAATRELLRRSAARVAIEEVERRGDRLSFRVRVTNESGHKLPTAHPSRRAWLQVTVRDAEGAVVLAAGGTDAAGRIVGADGRPLASELAGGPIAPHRDRVRGPDEVALYRAVMADGEGAPTHLLMRGARWWLDDRLLPAGWSAEHPEAARTAPVGTGADADFRAGGDRVRYELAVPPGPLRIDVALVHQALSARWAAELFRHEAPEIEAFRAMYERAERGPELLASASRSLPGG